MDALYTPPILRIGPYLVGIITGYIVVKLNGTLVLRKVNIKFYFGGIPSKELGFEKPVSHFHGSRQIFK